jgi:hypothetical protein
MSSRWNLGGWRAPGKHHYLDAQGSKFGGSLDPQGALLAALCEAKGRPLKNFRVPEVHSRVHSRVLALDTEPLHKAEWETCPACPRIQDDYPAGELTLSGGFLKDHAREIIRVVRNTEALENQEHPRQRFMGVKQAGDHLVITTTDIHLARRIAHGIEDAYKGELVTHYDDPG